MTLHHTFLTTCKTKPTWTADGRAQDPDSLISLLESKGVPAKNAAERAKQVREKLGPHQVQQALRANNPWAALKAAASKPGKMFRLVTEAELQDYINERAQTKHGAKVQHPKAKKQASQKVDQYNLTLMTSNWTPSTSKMKMGNLCNKSTSRK